MGKKERYHIDIFGLKPGTHTFDFIINEEFFKSFANSLIEEGDGKAEITLEKTTNHVKATLLLNITVELTCDRSLEKFDYLIDKEQTIIFKYGDHEEELDVDLFMIPHDTQRIDFGQHIFDYIGLSVPYKKLHPKFEGEEEKETDEMIFQTDIPSEEEKEEDPRWAALKKLKK